MKIRITIDPEDPYNVEVSAVKPPDPERVSRYLEWLHPSPDELELRAQEKGDPQEILLRAYERLKGKPLSPSTG